MANRVKPVWTIGDNPAGFPGKNAAFLPADRRNQYYIDIELNRQGDFCIDITGDGHSQGEWVCIPQDIIVALLERAGYTVSREPTADRL